MKRSIVSAVALGLFALVASVRTGAQTPAAAGPTFTKDVAPIFYKSCTNCHRPGEIAPMSLLTYKDARPWAKSIATQVAKGAMPPWHADPSHGEFLNDRRISETEKTMLVAWANAGEETGAGPLGGVYAVSNFKLLKPVTPLAAKNAAGVAKPVPVVLS